MLVLCVVFCLLFFGHFWLVGWCGLGLEGFSVCWFLFVLFLVLFCFSFWLFCLFVLFLNYDFFVAINTNY